MAVRWRNLIYPTERKGKIRPGTFPKAVCSRAVLTLSENTLYVCFDGDFSSEESSGERSKMR
jgi:hypothetical protein